MDIDLPTVDPETAPVWSMFFAVVSLLTVASTILLWAIITFSAVGSVFPRANAIEVGKVSASVLGIVINLGLSAGLLYIYVRQTGVLRDQKDLSAEQTSIQEQQRKIMGAEYVPEVNIFVKNVEENKIILHCSNEGTGLAKQFEVDVDFFVSTGSMDGPSEYHRGIELSALSDNVFTSTSETHPHGEITQEAHYIGKASMPRQKVTDDNLAQVRTSEILREGDDAALQFRLYFERFVDPGGAPENPDNLSFSDGIDALKQEGIETLGFRMRVSYQDIFDEEAADEPLTSGWVEISDGTTVKEMLETAENRGVFQRDTHLLRDKGTTYYARHYSYI